MGERLAGQLREPQRTLLVPIPLHRTRRWVRGFDQALALADAAAVTSGLQVTRLLRRGRATVPQGSPGARSRRANVRGAFEARTHGPPKGWRVVWVDDVVSSGATVRAAQEALAGRGLRFEGVLCAGRAVRLRRSAHGGP